MNRYDAALSLIGSMTILGCLTTTGCQGNVSLLGERGSDSDGGPGTEMDATASNVNGGGTANTTLDAQAPPMNGNSTVGPDDGSGPMILDAMAPPIGDYTYDATFTPPAPGLAGFVFVVNGVGQTPLSCPHNNWDFAPPPAQDGGTVCAASFSPEAGVVPPCAGISSVFLVNTGSVPMAYTAQSSWDVGRTGGYPPGVDLGDPYYSLAGVLDPGANVNITSVYVGGITAVLGSSQRFSDPDAGKYVSDESTIAWPEGVSGSEGASQMNVAQLDIVTDCSQGSPQVW
jgi:hypothetical protein